MAGVAGMFAAVFTAAAVLTGSSFREMNGIIETSAIAAGAPAAVINNQIFLEVFVFSQLLHGPSQNGKTACLQSKPILTKSPHNGFAPGRLESEAFSTLAQLGCQKKGCLKD